MDTARRSWISKVWCSCLSLIWKVKCCFLECAQHSTESLRWQTGSSCFLLWGLWELWDGRRWLGTGEQGSLFPEQGTALNLPSSSLGFLCQALQEFSGTAWRVVCKKVLVSKNSPRACWGIRTKLGVCRVLGVHCSAGSHQSRVPFSHRHRNPCDPSYPSPKNHLLPTLICWSHSHIYWHLKYPQTNLTVI